MTSGIDWTAVRKDLDSQEWQDTYDGDRQERLSFLGTVFHLYPSGKYYMPFACSNVEVCETCAQASDAPCDEDSPCVPPIGYDEDEEYHCEVCQDAAFLENLELEAEKHGLFIGCGEGDPCDIFAGESRDEPEEDDQ